MTNKLHNRTLFVAALSVYFGLLIVGAPPQVLAQASSTALDQRLQHDQNFKRIFECSQAKLGTRRKENNEPGNIDDYVDTLTKLVRYSECISPDGYAFIGELSYKPNYLWTGSFRTKPVSKSSWTSRVLTDYSENFASTLPRVHQSNDKYFALDFELNETNLSCTAKFRQETDEQAQHIATLFENHLINAKTVHRNSVKTVIFESTKISFENNQVLVITNLPRAALDTLLKADEKAN